MSASRYPFHSFIFSVYPIIHLYAVNMVFVPASAIFRSLEISIGITLFFLLAFFLILKNISKAGLLCSLLLAMFYSFGHITNALLQMGHSLPVSMLAYTWLALFLIILFFAVRQSTPARLTLLLNIISIGLLAFPLFSIIATRLSSRPEVIQQARDRLAEIRGQAQAEASLLQAADKTLPDIYMIVLDSYERADVLNEYYGYDNSEFIRALEERGFYVASQSHSNFLNTTYSLNTSLNLVYFNDFPDTLMQNARLNLQTNYVSDFLRTRGYQIIVFDSGTGDSNNQYSDVFVTPPPPSAGQARLINSFEELLIRTTLGLTLLKSDDQASTLNNAGEVLVSSVNNVLASGRERLAHTFTHLPDYAADDQPQFLFAHIYSPHIPFLFGPNGEPLTYQNNMSMYWYEPAQEDYIEQYGYQIDALNPMILATIDRILAQSTVPPVIILQSDHGDDHFLNWNAPTAQGIQIRSSILNAIYLPGGESSALYPTVTSVNTFRIILNQQFGTSYPLLADRIFFHEHSGGASRNVIPTFLNACEQFKVCLPAPNP